MAQENFKPSIMFTRSINTVPIENGQQIASTVAGEKGLYYDVNNTRINVLGEGSTVTTDGVIQSSWETNEKSAVTVGTTVADVSFKKDPQTQITEMQTQITTVQTTADSKAERSYIGQIIEFEYGNIAIETLPPENRFDTLAKVETYFGGTWEAYALGRALVGVGTSDREFVAGNAGGASTHTLSIAEMPSHGHDIIASLTGGNSDSLALGSDTNYTAYNTAYPRGGGQSHDNLQPYKVVYMWRRIA